MAVIKKTERDEYIVVHHVYGESDVIDFLRMTSRNILEKLCFDAKTCGEAIFEFKTRTYRMTRDKSEMYIIEQTEGEDEQDVG